MLTNITINRSYSIGSTSQLQSIIWDQPIFQWNIHVLKLHLGYWICQFKSICRHSGWCRWSGHFFLSAVRCWQQSIVNNSGIHLLLLLCPVFQQRDHCVLCGQRLCINLRKKWQHPCNGGKKLRLVCSAWPSCISIRLWCCCCIVGLPRTYIMGSLSSW